jgi:uncharacterized protein
MARRAILTAIAWLCLSVAGFTQTGTAQQKLTFPALTGRVVDGAGLLTAADRAALTDTLAALEAKTTDQLVVVTLNSLPGTTIEDYGYQLGRHWQIGQKDKNNGVLMIVAAQDRAVRIEVGYGLEGTLTDALSRVIIESAILPRFKAGDFPGGIKRGVDDIVRVLTGDAADLQRAATPGRTATDASIWPVLIVVLVVVGLLIVCAVSGNVVCGDILRMLMVVAMSSGRGGSSGGGSSFSGGGGSFGGGGSSGRW